MNYKYGDLVKVIVEFLPTAAPGDTATVQHINPYGGITILLEDGDNAGKFEQVIEEDIELIDRLTDEDLELLKEEL